MTTKSGVLAIALLTTSLCGCAIRRERAAERPVSGGDWLIMQTGNPGEHYVIIRSQTDLQKALKRMGCGPHPCSIARVGEMYVVSDLGPAAKK